MLGALSTQVLPDSGIWSDGSEWPANAAAYWAPEQPDGPSGFCVEINFDPSFTRGEWNDLECSSANNAICQRDMR